MVKKSIINQIYVAICIFIENKLNIEYCKRFLSDLLSNNVNKEQLSIMGDSGEFLMEIAKNFKESGVTFNEIKTSLIIEDYTKHVYATSYYIGIMTNKELSLQDRQKAKNNLIIRDALCATIKGYLTDSTRGRELKKIYKEFKTDFEVYKTNTQVIIDMITNNPNDNESIREAIKERVKESKKLNDKYSKYFDVGEYNLRSVLEDDILENKRKDHLSELEQSVADLIA